MKGTRHIELRENSVRKWVPDKTFSVQHVSGKVNPANIFTNEMKDRAHFWCFHDSFMSRLSDFNISALLAVHHTQQLSSTSGIPTAPWAVIESVASCYFSALASSTFCRTYIVISHLSSFRQQLLQNLHGFIPPGIS
jgi:hypothetical protein